MKKFDINDIQLEIQTPRLEVDEKDEKKIVSHIEKLGKIFPGMTKCIVLIKYEKDSKDKNLTGEAKVFIPGEMIFTKQSERTVALLIRNIFDDVHDQLMRTKEKQQA